MRSKFGLRSILPPVLSGGVVALGFSIDLQSQLPDATGDQQIFFETKIRPVLAQNCFSCHGPDSATAGLRLDSSNAVSKGSDNGKVIVPGDPEKSLLIKVIRHQGPIKMPMGKKLKPSEIADIETWVRAGAFWPKESNVPGAKKEKEPLWSLLPVQNPQPPKVKKSAWVRDPIDSFVLAKLEQKKMSPASESDKKTLLRRVTFDLIGLSPSQSEVDSFIADKSDAAYENVVDRLLASPRYGERWARHWLDVARYADTKGYVFVEDRNYPHAYTFRQWVIEALNQDLPYDQFLMLQLAADRLVGGNEDRKSLAAMGFLTVGRRFLNNVPDIIDDRIDVTTRGMMGFTVACARCHDHKFDPIPTQDYYSLYAVFDSSVESSIAISDKLVREPWEKNQAGIDESNRQLETIIRSETKRLRGEKDLSPEVKKTLQDLRVEELATGTVLKSLLLSFQPEQRTQILKLQNTISNLQKNSPPSPEFAMAMQDKPNARDGVVFKRGHPGNRGEVAPRRFLKALTSKDETREHWNNGSGRLELAKSIASRQNPLTARVIVNRVWMHHFGQGIVRTPSDFGYQGELPTHPELLDHLATRFMNQGWSLKKLHRWIVTSSTYRQSSDATSTNIQTDPENRLIGRMNRRRLDLEQMRDSMLQISEKLDLSQTGGRSVDLWKKPFTNRRAVYGFIERQNLPGIFRTFDFASPDSTNSKRFFTTVPQQALFMMNSPFAVENSIQVSKTLESGSPQDRVIKLFERVYLRRPNQDELAACVKYISQPDPQPLTDDWSYGYGGITTSGKVNFTPLLFFTSGRYSASGSVPDPNVGWVQLTATGGHPGRGENRAVIRRWTSSIDGKINISGELSHPSASGDGVIGKIVSSRKGVVGAWKVQRGKVTTSVMGVTVGKGDTIDFVVECGVDENSDSFAWSPDILSVQPVRSWSARSEFHEPIKTVAPSRLALLAQTLMMSNEFMFID
jgi:hypothetical protein